MSPPLTKLNGGSIRLKWLEKTFVVPLNDADDKVLCMYALNYYFNLLSICEL